MPARGLPPTTVAARHPLGRVGEPCCVGVDDEGLGRLRSDSGRRSQKGSVGGVKKSVAADASCWVGEGAVGGGMSTSTSASLLS